MKKLTIATHNGKFHIDEVMSIAILKIIYPNCEILRIRDEKEIKKAEIRVDIGKKYNPRTNDFDHHQINSPIRKNKIPYSSCGLIWKHFGKKITNSKEVWEYIDKEIIEFIDSIDNGIEMPESKINIYSLQEIIKNLNPFWNENISETEQFNKAVELMQEILKREIKKAESIKKGNELVRKCLKKSKKEFIILPDPRLPKKHLIENKNIKFAIYPDNKKNWISLAIPIKEKSFKSKKLFPKSWAGFEKEELEKISQRKGALFCHKNRFIIVTKTKDSAIELTKKALKEKD